ncbi:MAG: hypothetical protein RBT56_04090 [Ignavibacteriaceae bacterium]|jgi:hypothetical protein|nr:hypothetical protein [Ignavibacteriaceae bacterium]
MMVINPNDFYGVFDKFGHFSDFHNYSSIGDWQIRTEDKYCSYVGNGNRPYLLVVNHSSHWAAILKFNEPSWTWLWSNNGNNNILGWIMNSSDKYSCGNIISSNVKHEFIISNTSSGQAAIFDINQSSIQNLWGNGGNHYIGPHYIDAFDQYFVIKGLGSTFSSLMAINLLNARTQKFNKNVAQDEDETAE